MILGPSIGSISLLDSPDSTLAASDHCAFCASGPGPGRPDVVAPDGASRDHPLRGAPGPARAARVFWRPVDESRKGGSQDPADPSGIPETWDFIEFRKVLDAQTLTQALEAQLRQWLNQRLGIEASELEPVPALDSSLPTPTPSLDIFNLRDEVIDDYRRYIELQVALCCSVGSWTGGRSCKELFPCWCVIQPRTGVLFVWDHHPENSDFLTIHNAFSSWRRACANPGIVRKFCRSNFLSHQVRVSHLMWPGTFDSQSVS